MCHAFHLRRRVFRAHIGVEPDSRAIFLRQLADAPEIGCAAEKYPADGVKK
jgi:hypothetical protein